MPAPALVERVDPASRRLRPVAVVDTLARSVTIEMDLRLEAAALSEMAELTAGDHGLPRAEGRVGADRARRADPRMDRRHQALRSRRRFAPPATTCRRWRRRLMQAFLRHALRDGFFHADMHQGNLFVDAAGDIVAVDFGIMGRLDAGRSGASSPRSSSASSAATTGASPRCISRRATSPPRGIRSTTSPRRSAPSASRSTASGRATSRWRGC